MSCMTLDPEKDGDLNGECRVGHAAAALSLGETAAQPQNPVRSAHGLFGPGTPAPGSLPATVAITAVEPWVAPTSFAASFAALKSTGKACAIARLVSRHRWRHATIWVAASR